MGRIIDADELKRELAWLYKNAEWGSREIHFSLADMECNIDMMPTVYIIRHAKWIGGELGYCSACGHSGCFSDIWDGCLDMFCPNCGARMDDETD